MNKLQVVTDKICELLKGTELDPIHYDTVNLNHGPIQEAEVLTALNKLESTVEILNCGAIVDLDDHDVVPCGAWLLGKTLVDQSPETIDFLFTVLNCEG